MCGITGIANLRSAAPPDRDAITRMLSVLEHRGPDAMGIYCDSLLALGHARLSIVDLQGGFQPLTNEDQTIWITFNGEIFNHRELREQLIALGHRFRSHSDTEVIVHAYEAWGLSAFRRMNGQWSLALWDSRSRRLLLARDRFGVHPLYYTEHSGRLYFASSIRSIFAADPTIPREFDPRGLDEVFTFWTPVAPQTVFAGIRELEPGCARIYENGLVYQRDLEPASYPEAQEQHFGGSLADAAQLVRAHMEEAISLRVLSADVPVGSYLSGGLDSSLVAALARRQVHGSLKTFSLRFGDEEYDETGYQREMAKRLETEHHELVVGAEDIAACFPELIAHTERPVLRTAAAPLMLLSRLVRAHGIKAVLTGEGADEVFAGYDLFREGKVRRFWSKFPDSRLRPRALERLYPYLARSPVRQQAMARAFFGRDLENARAPGFAHRPRWNVTSNLKRLFSASLRGLLDGQDAAGRLLEALPPEFARWSSLAQDQHIEIRTLLQGYLMSCQGDRALMANSVEGRFPFLDRKVVALADSLPPEHKLKVLDEKHVLKRAAGGLVCDSILRRPKQPYRAPDARAFVGAGASWVPELLEERSVREAGVFDPPAVVALWRKCRGTHAQGTFSNADNMALVGVLSTQLLHRQLVRSPIETSALNIPLRVDHVAT